MTRLARRRYRDCRICANTRLTQSHADACAGAVHPLGGDCHSCRGIGKGVPDIQRRILRVQLVRGRSHIEEITCITVIIKRSRTNEDAIQDIGTVHQAGIDSGQITIEADRLAVFDVIPGFEACCGIDALKNLYSFGRRAAHFVRSQRIRAICLYGSDRRRAAIVQPT